MELNEYISQKIIEKSFTKKHVYSALGMTQRGFILMLENNSITVYKYLEICKILSIPPEEYFILYHSKTQSGGSIMNKSIAEVNVNAENSQMIKELVKQNGELISVINNLTKK
jgi:hypothetical protein